MSISSMVSSDMCDWIGVRNVRIVRIMRVGEVIRAAAGSFLLTVGVLTLCGHLVVHLGLAGLNLPPAGAVLQIPNSSWLNLSKYCMHNDYVHGQWVYNSDLNLSKEFVCCGYDSEQDHQWNKMTLNEVPNVLYNNKLFFGL
jgi:hypothetical protein